MPNACGFAVRTALLLGLGVSVCLAADPGVDALYQEFKDPPRVNTIRPFWFWNGKLDAAEVNRQIEEMAAHGVYGAYVHNRTGLETRYMSEEYFDVVKQAFAKAKQVGFHLGFVDEYEWPSGEARDVWRQGIPSRVVAANPEFGMRSLGYIARKATGPKAVEIEGPEHVQFAVAAKMTGEESIDPNTLRDISASLNGATLHWTPPDGDWLVMIYYLYPSRGLDGGTVDLMNAAAVRKFLDLVHEEYYKRFGEYYGDVLDSMYADHEGAYGYRMAWTPALFDTFRKMKGYDLRQYLPLLTHDGGKMTTKVRCDYLDVVSELYYESFFKQVADWAQAHKIKTSGHVWEEALHFDAAFQGDLMRVMRGFSWPGVDSLFDRGRSPRDFKAAASVAHFRGTRFTCENQGLQGSDSYLDLQKMRLGTNTIGAWGVATFIPHAFNYNRRRIEYPEDWFYHQPYWKYFQHYADYTRRISYMNADSVHVADVLVFQPTETAWANSKPVFNESYPYRFAFPPKWNNPLDTANAYYGAIMNHLTSQRWDYDIVDSYWLLQGAVEGKEIHIGNERFKVLVLPPATTMRRAALEKIRQFYDQGGTVIAIRFLPTGSMEEGDDDPAIAEQVRHIFGDASQNSNAAGGKAFFVKEDVKEISRILENTLQQDFHLKDAAREEHVFYEHRRKNGADYYWLVNDSEDAKDYSAVFSAKGAPRKWDAETAERTPLYYHSTPEGTEVRLHFDPWDAWFLVFDPQGEAQPVRVVETNLDQYFISSRVGDMVVVRGSAPLESPALSVRLADAGGNVWAGRVAAQVLPTIELSGAWSFTPEKKSLGAPYARRRLDYRGEGEKLGWHTAEYQDVTWERQWLSRERHTIRRWALAGPYPNENHQGTVEAYAPEKGVDLDAPYWTRYDSDTYVVDLEKGLGIPHDKNWITSYAVSYIYAPTARKAYFKITANNSAKLWVNGQNLLDWHIHPFYYEMREDFALTRPADLRQGWNEVLVKVSKCQWANEYAFLLRVTDEQERNFDDLVFSPEKREVGSVPESPKVAAWYRIPVPPAAVGVKRPAFHGPVTVYYDGAKLDPRQEIRFPRPAEGAGNVLVVRVDRDDEFADEPVFLLGPTKMPPGSWTFNGLPYYSGSASYERDFELPATYHGHKLMLDCGQVGAVAAVTVNGKPAGVRVWLPYSFDITPYARPGKNTVRITVTNTMENERSVENRAFRLENIKLNGLLGPVKVVPYFEGEIRCERPRAME